MRLPFVNRTEELAELRRAFDAHEPTFTVLYGRRRCGKSRLLVEAAPAHRCAYFVADEREPPLLRAALAREIARVLPGFAGVLYPDWDALFTRWWADAPRGAVLAIDELPALVSSSPEIPSLLRRHIDRARRDGPHLVVAGSSQRLMQGLVLDRSAPLFGRATGVLRVQPLHAGTIKAALRLNDDVAAVESFAVWGGVPRYWELAADHADRASAVRALVLSPRGVLYDEPASLLLEDLHEIAQSASILTLIGQGCHRLSEIAGRLGKPATSLSRPMERLLDLDLVRRDVPFGASLRDTKRTAYRIADPFLRFWFRFVEPNRSLLEAGRVDVVERELASTSAQHVAGVWEELVRQAVPRAAWAGRRFGPASSWWGPGLDRQPMEIDVLADGDDGALLVGEVKWSDGGDERVAAELARKAANLPLAQGREVVLVLWSKRGGKRTTRTLARYGPKDVLSALR